MVWECTCASEGLLSRVRLRVLRFSHGAECFLFVHCVSFNGWWQGSVHKLEGEDWVDADTSEGGDEGC